MMIVKKVLLVPVKYQAKLEKGMITNKGCILDINGDMIYVSNRVDGNEVDGCQEWWLSEVHPVKFYLVSSTDLNEKNMTKGAEYYDGKGSIRIWGTGHVYNLNSKIVVATPDQIGYIPVPKNEIDVLMREVTNSDIDDILKNAGECYVEVDGTPCAISKPVYYKEKVIISNIF